MIAKLIKFIYGAILTASIVNSNELPEYIQVCHRNDSKINDCIVSSIEKIKPYLAKGIPEIDVPSLEPLYLDELALVDGNSGYAITIKAKDVTVYGAANFHINKLTVTENIQHIKGNLTLPDLKVEGRYSAVGQILALPIRGDGHFNGEFINLNAIVKIDTELQTIDDSQRLLVKAIKINSKLDTGKLILHDLFGGDKAVGQIINDAINSNFNMLASEFVPIIEKELEQKFKDISDKILMQFTYDQIMPE